MLLEETGQSHRDVPVPDPRRFLLVRDEDVTGVSGTGAVAQGVEFGDGPCVMHWIVPPARSTAFYSSIQELALIHGHGGRTRIHYLDL